MTAKLTAYRSMLFLTRPLPCASPLHNAGINRGSDAFEGDDELSGESLGAMGALFVLGDMWDKYNEVSMLAKTICLSSCVQHLRTVAPQGAE